jgi:hypothetical protein
MRKKKPIPAAIAQARSRRDDNDVIIEYADPHESHDRTAVEVDVR